MFIPWAPALITLALSAPLLAQTLKDPTRPPGEHVGSAGQAQAPLTLSAVLGSQPALAIINGQVLKVGDKVQGWTLRHIFKDEVLLVSAGQQQKLTVFDHSAVTSAYQNGH
ncbi:SctD/MshK family protein [Gallaecimonas mangrovi]|uniref:SctD/MshK family protein n=1 Tax=Gallaecimonas mangrovi TaxID=2291597 RepID=UPI0012602462|nr:MSHA biogenesis protein MshK [Gallaecimonas mangrovi]